MQCLHYFSTTEQEPSLSLANQAPTCCSSVIVPPPIPTSTSASTFSPPLNPLSPPLSTNLSLPPPPPPLTSPFPQHLPLLSIPLLPCPWPVEYSRSEDERVGQWGGRAFSLRGSSLHPARVDGGSLHPGFRGSQTHSSLASRNHLLIDALDSRFQNLEYRIQNLGDGHGEIGDSEGASGTQVKPQIQEPPSGGCRQVSLDFQISRFQILKMHYALKPQIQESLADQIRQQSLDFQISRLSIQDF